MIEKYLFLYKSIFIKLPVNYAKKNIIKYIRAHSFYTFMFLKTRVILNLNKELNKLIVSQSQIIN